MHHRIPVNGIAIDVVKARARDAARRAVFKEIRRRQILYYEMIEGLAFPSEFQVKYLEWLFSH
jgi:hypothetical protein